MLSYVICAAIGPYTAAIFAAIDSNSGSVSQPDSHLVGRESKYKDDDNNNNNNFFPT